MESNRQIIIALAVFNAAVTGYLFLYALSDVAGGWLQSCSLLSLTNPQPDPTKGVVFYKTGFGIVDRFTCLGATFSEPVLRSAVGTFLMRGLFAHVVPVFLLIAMESQRMGASGFVAMYSSVIFLAINVMFGTTYLAWVLVYWSRRAPQAADTRVGRTKAIIILLATLLMAFSWQLAAVTSLQLNHTVWFIGCLLGPPVYGLLFVYAPHGDMAHVGKKLSPTTASHPRLYAFALVAGVAATWHFWALGEYMAASAEGTSLWPAVLNAGIEHRSEHFLMIDLLLNQVASAVFVYLSDRPAGGLAGLLWFTALSVPFGPGAALACCLQLREMHLLAQEADSGLLQDQKQS